MDLSVLIVNWNVRNSLRLCLDSVKAELERNPRIRAEVILVDNASTDGSVEMVILDYGWVNLIQNNKNRGFGKANNQAASFASGNRLLLLNPDAFLHEGAINSLMDFLDSHPKAGAVGPKVINADGSIQVSAHPFPTLFRETWRLFHLDRFYPLSQYQEEFYSKTAPSEVDVLKGACILLRKVVIEREALFDEQYFMYSEEVDLCMRMHESGWGIFWLPDAEITHSGGQSTSQAADEMFIELYRNKIRFFRKHYGDAQARIYKGVLLLASAARIFSVNVFKFSHTDQKLSQTELGRQYTRLIRMLPSL